MANPIAGLYQHIFGASDPAPVAPNPGPAAPDGTGNPGNIPTPITPVADATPGTAPNGVIPVAPPEAPEDSSPLAPFKQLWEDVPVDPNNPTKPTAPVALDPKEVQDLVAKIDLTTVITPEQKAAITAGGEEGQAAFVAALNAVSQNTLAQATLASSKLAERNIQTAVERATASLPDLVRQSINANHLAESNPVFNNPAIKPVLDEARGRLEVQFPSESPAQITQRVNDYALAMAAAFSPPAPKDPNVLEDTDWSGFETR